MLCHICNSSVESFIDENSSILYHICHSCEYIFKDPENYRDFSEQKKRYNLHENNPEDEGYRAYFQRFLDFVLPQLESVNSALDFGCGRSNLLASMLEEQGISCDAYDPIYHPDTLNKNKKYDLIVSTEVFEHLHNPKEIFESLVGMLNSGGFLALQTQFHPNEIEEFKRWYYHKDPTHIVFFRVESFEVLASLYNCKVVNDNEKNMILIKKI